MKIQVLTFPDCPNAEPARRSLREAMRAAGVDSAVDEIDIGRGDAPADLRAWGSPTILIDGADVMGAKPTGGEIGCRLYTGGAPNVEQIRAALRGAPRRSAGWPLAGAIVAAVAASACCIVPAILAVVGLSGAGIAAAFAALRPYFLVVTAVALGAGLWLAYRRSKTAPDACGCAVPRRRCWTRAGLWLGVALTVGIAAYPYVYSGTGAAGTSARGVAEIRLHVDGMDCRACTKTLAEKLAKVRGVASAHVDYDSEEAVVMHDGTRDPTADLLSAVDRAGYQAHVIAAR